MQIAPNACQASSAMRPSRWSNSMCAARLSAETHSCDGGCASMRRVWWLGPKAGPRTTSDLTALGRPSRAGRFAIRRPVASIRWHSTAKDGTTTGTTSGRAVGRSTTASLMHQNLFFWGALMASVATRHPLLAHSRIPLDEAPRCGRITLTTARRKTNQPESR